MNVQPFEKYFCVQYIPKKNFKFPIEVTAVGGRQAAEKCCWCWLALYYFGKYKPACSIAFELPSTHLHIAFSWWE